MLVLLNGWIALPKLVTLSYTGWKKGILNQNCYIGQKLIKDCQIYHQKGEYNSSIGYKEMKIADPVLLSLFIRDNKKCNIPHAN